MRGIGQSAPTGVDREGSQDYLATVSDLVSAFIFVFVITLAIVAYHLATAKEEQDKETERQRDLTDELLAADETRDSILREIARRLRDAGMRVQVLEHQGVLRLSQNAINFPSGGEAPSSEHRGNVGRVAAAIAEVARCYVADDAAVAAAGTPDRPLYCATTVDPSASHCSGAGAPWLIETLLIEGHTDDTPVARGHRFTNNLELSSMRAATVHRMITDCEPGVQRLENRAGDAVLSTSGYGATRPATMNPDRRDDNRRIDLRFLMEPAEGTLVMPGPSVVDDMRGRLRERER